MRYRNHRCPAGFTLVEMLMVILVIGILVGLVFNVVQRIVGTGETTTAKQEVRALEAGIQLYRTDNDRFPTQGATESADPTPKDTASDATLVQILVGGGSLDDNPRHRVYFEPAKLTGAGCVDPWGKGYKIAMDYDGDGMVTCPTGNVRASVAVWSTGPLTGGGTNWIGSW